MLFYNPLKAVSPFVYRLASMSKYLPKTKDYYERVTLDLGTVRYLGDVNTFYKFLEEENLYNNTKLLWFGDAGIKTRETTVASTPLTFVSKGYSLDPTPNDLTQTTELNQPYLSGNIAPNERYAVKINTNSETKLLTHPDIVVTTPHTVVKVVELETTGKVEITHTEVNGVTLNTLNDVGRVYYYRIHDGAMTAEQKEAEAAFLRSIYPEIPSVQIGTQTWATSNLEMVATPMGNVIPQVQLDADWANATNLYDAAIAGGATEVDAIKAAAMWCYYNNDPNIGAVYGKIYNGYAAKLIQNDIDAYNAANPTTPWGWRVPTVNDFEVLRDFVEPHNTGFGAGNNTVAWKLMVSGLDYFLSPNNGTNETGFSAIGSGYRSIVGSFANYRTVATYFLQNYYFIDLSRNSGALLSPNNFGGRLGLPIRLIKDE